MHLIAFCQFQLPVRRGSHRSNFQPCTPMAYPGGGIEVVDIAFFKHFKDFDN